MSEAFTYINKQESAGFWKKVVPQEKGVMIENKHFPKAIGIIGGGTGLEALRLARENPNAAIFVIDPFSQFAANVIDQMTTPGYKSKRKIDWGFFEQDKGLQYIHEQIWDAYQNRPEAWKKVDHAFNKYAGQAEELAHRMFFVEERTSDFIPEKPIFDNVNLIYPNPQLCREPSLYKFVSRSLRQDGTWTIVTESIEDYIRYYGQEKPYVISHGAVQRNKVDKPLSLYDAVFNRNYSFIEIKKTTDRLKEPSLASIFLAETAPWALVQMTSELVSRKKVVRREK